jgi:hypothetical protein
MNNFQALPGRSSIRHVLARLGPPRRRAYRCARGFQRPADQIDEEAARRLDLFARTNRKNGLPVTKIEEYNASVDSDRQMPRVMFIADEANNYLEDPQIKERITRIVRTSLKCGISTVLAAHSCGLRIFQKQLGPIRYPSVFRHFG